MAERLALSAIVESDILDLLPRLEVEGLDLGLWLDSNEASSRESRVQLAVKHVVHLQLLLGLHVGCLGCLHCLVVRLWNLMVGILRWHLV